MIRANKGWSWFHANWGYEESKHSLALGDWLLRSGHRTEEQMADLEDQLSQTEWELPQDSPHGMLIYAMTQEMATWLHYRNLRLKVLERHGDPALSTLLQYIAVDEPHTTLSIAESCKSSLRSTAKRPWNNCGEYCWASPCPPYICWPKAASASLRSKRLACSTRTCTCATSCSRFLTSWVSNVASCGDLQE